MTRVRQRTLQAVAALVWIGMSTPAPAAWKSCPTEWSASSMLRGPSGLGNAILAPFRNSAGAVRWAVADSTSRSVWARILAVPTLGGLSFGLGFIDTEIWLTTGLADTLTGGYFEFVPDDAAHLSVEPLQPFFVPGPRPERPPCGARGVLFPGNP